MVTLLDDAAVLHHIDYIAVPHRGEAVRDAHNGQFAGHLLVDAVDGLLDHLLRGIVQSTGCLIQEENLGLLHKGPRYRDALLLAARELRASGADKGLQFLREILHEVQLGIDHGPFQILLGDVVCTLHDVAADGRCKEHRLLSHVTDATPQGLHRDTLDVYPVDEHFALLRVVEALKKTHDCALATPGLPHKGDAFTLGNDQ
mmetsp:Transcript_39775/g.86806  ORF Transcript_39775/g.86806 Transcript_39775/m.86806 type:complete len:202 (+) Transcript_39775:865-1470(+)